MQRNGIDVTVFGVLFIQDFPVKIPQGPSCQPTPDDKPTRTEVYLNLVGMRNKSFRGC